MSVDDALRADQWKWGCRMKGKTSWAAPFFSFSYRRFVYRDTLSIIPLALNP